MKHFLRIIIGISIVMLALSVTALSCNKTAGDKSNSGGGGTGGDGSGGGNNGGGGGNTPPYSICADKGSTSCLELDIDFGATGFAKLDNKTNIVINAADLATTINRVLSDTDDNNRSFHDAFNLNADMPLFDVKYPGVTEALTFVSLKEDVNGKDITTNSIVLEKAVDDPDKCTSSSESADNTFATRPEGGHCIETGTGGYLMGFYSYLGTLFKNPTPATYARGTMRCDGALRTSDTSGNAQVIDDSKLIRKSEVQTCEIAVVNSGNTAAAATINDNWVDTSAGSTTEVELYAVGIDITGKTIPDLLPAADNFTLAKLKNGFDNATFKKLLVNNSWRDLRFKVKIVKAAAY